MWDWKLLNVQHGLCFIKYKARALDISSFLDPMEFPLHWKVSLKLQRVSMCM